MPERGQPFLQLWIILREGYHDSDPAHLLGLLCVRPQRPRRRRRSAE
jgi:hypothetical protein